MINNDQILVFLLILKHFKKLPYIRNFGLENCFILYNFLTKIYIRQLFLIFGYILYILLLKPCFYYI
jgi:hypothetical protein